MLPSLLPLSRQRFAVLVVVALGALALAGCRGQEQARQLGKLRLGEGIESAQLQFGPSGFTVNNVKTGGTMVWSRGKDGGQVTALGDKKGRIISIMVTTRDYPGTAEGIKVGSDKTAMLKAYGDGYKVLAGPDYGGYVYNYRRGSYRLAFVYESYKAPRVQAIILDRKVDLLK